MRAAWLLVGPFLVFARPTPALVGVGLALAAVGLWIRGWSAGTIHKDERLTTSGPYAFTRNPLYLGSFLIGLGVSIAGGHWIWPALFVAFFATVYGRTMAREAERLVELFGDEYRAYATAVPGFVPRPLPYRGSAGPQGVRFQWSQYRRHREWEASLGALAAFAFLLAKSLLGS
jgi:protein-S-isoprenylcysteine O-methyltransferase Ste14